MKKTFLAVVADDKGEVFEHPELLFAGMSGDVVVRPQAEYARSLRLLARAAERGASAVKSGLMVGVGETASEVAQVLSDLADAGVTMVTVGQYLRPTRDSLAVSEYVRPEVFDCYKEVGERLGLLVEAGPFVRSSFAAGRTFAEIAQRRGKSPVVELQ